jgi:hypothetical protein
MSSFGGVPEIGGDRAVLRLVLVGLVVLVVVFLVAFLVAILTNPMPPPWQS